jgi:hypothetical protein
MFEGHCTVQAAAYSLIDLKVRNVTNINIERREGF